MMTRLLEKLLDDLLQSCGYQSRVFASAEAFLSEADRGTIDCMLVDVKMPGLSGIELQALLSDDPARLPMIFMTSCKDERTRSAVIDGGAFTFLAEPVDVTQFDLCARGSTRRRHSLVAGSSM